MGRDLPNGAEGRPEFVSDMKHPSCTHSPTQQHCPTIKLCIILFGKGITKGKGSRIHISHFSRSNG